MIFPYDFSSYTLLRHQNIWKIQKKNVKLLKLMLDINNELKIFKEMLTTKLNKWGPVVNYLGAPCSRLLCGKESACTTGDTGDIGSIPGSGRYLEGENGNPLQYSFLEKSMVRSLEDNSLWGFQRITHGWAWALVNYLVFVNNYFCIFESAKLIEHRLNLSDSIKESINIYYWLF